MSIIIESGITVGPGIYIGGGSPTPPTGGMLFEYNAGNSMSYSGSGANFNDAQFNNGPNNYNVNYLFDLNSDIGTATLGNYGVFNTDTSNAASYWVSQGLSSYFNFVPADNTYIDSSDSNGHTIPGNSSFTYFAMVNVNNFGDNVTPTGGIVGGDQSAFGFFPPNTAPFSNPYPILFACAQQGSIGNYVFDLTTQFQPDTWYAVAFTYDATSQTGKLYVNGVNTSTQTNMPPFTNNEPLYWGTFEGFNWLNGKMSVMSAWDRVLSPSEIVTYTNSVKAPYQSIPLQTYSQLFDTPGQHDFIVPVGVTNISIVAVGAGGSGTQSAYSAPGQLSGLFDPSTTVTAQTTLVSNTQIQVDGTTYPGILNVTTDYMVAGLDINNTYPNVVPAALLVVSSIDTTDPGNVLITLSKPINTTSIGDEFTFTKALVAADGGYQNNDSGYDNGNGGPGPRALPLVYNGGGGRGGVVDYLQSWGLGGGGAGGYGVNDPIVAFDPNQTRIHNGDGDTSTGVANVVLELSNSNLTVAATANTTSSGIATGTYEIQNGDQVMFSLTVDAVSGPSGSGIGFGNYNANIAGFVGYDINSGAFYNDGNFYTGGHVDSSGYPTFTTGDVVDIAVANTGFGTSQLLWIRVNGGDWNGSNIANPATATNGVGITLYNPIYLMTSQGDNTSIGQWSINTSHTYSLPAGYTFITGSGDAGATGGDGSMDELYTAKEGQGIAGSGAGGAGRYDDSGTGGGGVGLYGSGNPGTLGNWASSNDLDTNYTGSVATGGRGGSRRGQSGTQGGQATAWNGGYGGWPGGGGGSATGYYDSGMGGALAFSNNIPVTPGHTYNVYVGYGGLGQDDGGNGANGAVRVIWPGNTRQFPHTAGSDPAGPNSFTIGTEDFTNYSNNGITANLSAGYVVSLTANAGSNIVDRYVNLIGLDNDTLAQDITAVYIQAGMANYGTLQYNGATPNPYQFNAYIFNVTWADNSTGKVRMSWNSHYGELILSVIDTAYTDWQTANPAIVGNPNPVLGGTFSFPATFTPYTPLIESNGIAWC
jgi:hypothetical protein